MSKEYNIFYNINSAIDSLKQNSTIIRVYIIKSEENDKSLLKTCKINPPKQNV